MGDVYNLCVYSVPWVFNDLVCVRALVTDLLKLIIAGKKGVKLTITRRNLVNSDFYVRSNTGC